MASQVGRVPPLHAFAAGREESVRRRFRSVRRHAAWAALETLAKRRNRPHPRLWRRIWPVAPARPLAPPRHRGRHPKMQRQISPSLGCEEFSERIGNSRAPKTLRRRWCVLPGFAALLGRMNGRRGRVYRRRPIGGTAPPRDPERLIRLLHHTPCSAEAALDRSCREFLAELKARRARSVRASGLCRSSIGSSTSAPSAADSQPSVSVMFSSKRA